MEEDDHAESEGDGSEAESEGDGRIREGSLRLKVRQHVNPLGARYQIPAEFKEGWLSAAFEKPYDLPLIIDIGETNTRIP